MLRFKGWRAFLGKSPSFLTSIGSRQATYHNTIRFQPGAYLMDIGELKEFHMNLSLQYLQVFNRFLIF